MTTKTKVTRNVLALIAALSFLLAACKPENIILSTSEIERQAKEYVQETCQKRADGTCKTMGE